MSSEGHGSSRTGTIPRIPPPGGPIPNKHWKKGLLFGGLALLAIGILLYYRFRKSPFQWGVFLATFTGVDWFWLLTSIGLILLTYVGRALRWAVMLQPLREHPSLWNINSATVIGFTAIFLLGRPGELVRPYLISVKERVSFSSQMAAWLLERIFDLLMVLLIFGYSLTNIEANAGFSSGLRWVLQTGGYLAVGIGAVCILVLVAFRSFSDVAQQRIVGALSFLPEAPRLRISRTVAAFAEGMVVTRSARRLGLLVFYTMLEWALILGGIYALLHAFSITSGLHLADVMIFVGFVSFGSVLQIPGIGGGVQVVSALVLTEIFGLPLEAATGMALLMWVLTFVVIVPFGLLFAFHEGINLQKLKHLPEEAGA